MLFSLCFICPLNSFAQPYVKRGIDVSYHNGIINWQAVKSDNIDFAILRTSFGWSNRQKFTDQQLINNINGTRNVGMPIGAYHYSYATTPHEALMEADFFLARLEWATWEYPVYMDFEDKCQMRLSKQQKTDLIRTFLNKIRSAGYYTGLYSSVNYQRNLLDMSRLADHDLWIAHWNSTCGCERPYGIWQYSSTGRVNGIRTNVDMNYCYINYPEKIRSLHLNRL